MTVSRPALPASTISPPSKTTFGNTSTDPLTSVETSARATEANAKTLPSTPQRPHTQRIPSALLITRLLSWRRRILALLYRLNRVRLSYESPFAQTYSRQISPGWSKAASDYSKVSKLSSGKGPCLLQNRRPGRRPGLLG